MDNEKRKMHPFFKILIIFFIIFIGFYIALESGYYPTRIKEKTLITNKNITEFEKDLREGKEVKVTGYIEEDEDYSNFITKTGNKLTYSLGKIIFKTIDGFNSTIKVLFW